MRAIVVEAKQTTLVSFINPSMSCPAPASQTLQCRGAILCYSRGMAAALPGRAEVDTSRVFRSVKEAVAVFGERIQFRPSAAAHGDPVNTREKNFIRSSPVAIAAPKARLDVSDGVPASGVLTRKSHHSKANANVNEGGISNNPSPNLVSAVQMTTRQVPDDVPMYLVPSSPPFFASSPSLATDEYEDPQHKDEEADLMMANTVKRLEEEAARTRQDVAQLKKRIAEMELSMATLNAKLHRALSKLAHMEADRAAAERASLVERGRGRSGGDVALALWAEQGRALSSGRRPPLGHLMRYGDSPNDDGEAAAVVGCGARELALSPVGRKALKRKPIVPLVFPLINGLLFPDKKRMKDKESVYMKELYSLLRLS